MAGRTFAHVAVTFQRTVTEQQTVDVAVDAGLDAATQQVVAKQLAPARLKAKWEATETTDAEIVGVK